MQIYRQMDDSYRGSFGLPLPPAGTKVEIEYMAGIQFHITWPDCSDGEDILYGWISSKTKALKIVEAHSWKIS